MAKQAGFRPRRMGSGKPECNTCRRDAERFESLVKVGKGRVDCTKHDGERHVLHTVQYLCK